MFKKVLRMCNIFIIDILSNLYWPISPQKLPLPQINHCNTSTALLYVFVGEGANARSIA